MFSICRNCNQSFRHKSFRPLSGMMFSIEKEMVLEAGMVVSVPSRGLCFQSNRNASFCTSSLGFPSPLGDYVFNPTVLRRFECMVSVSVPSRGLCFQSVLLLSMDTLLQCFRPLSGIMFSINIMSVYDLKLPKFPSPLGDYVFNQMKEAMNRSRNGHVSVPSRGLCFQSNGGIKWTSSIFGVSVPSRGLCFQSVYI